MNERLQDAEHTADTVRSEALAANRRAKQKTLPVLAGAAARVEDLRHQVARLFDQADGLVPSLGEAAAQVRRLIEELDVHYPDTLDLTYSSAHEDVETHHTDAG
jgi:ABC-type transporter Mla subunit MlaD